MNSFKKLTIFIIVVLPLLLGISKCYKETKTIVVNNGTRLEWASCWFQLPSFKRSKYINCAYLFPSSSNIRLPVVVITQDSDHRLSSPILYLTGGPGYSTGLDKKNIAFWLKWLKKNKFTNDLILFDQRGTGFSQPQPNCPEMMSLTYETLGKSLTLEEELSLNIAAIQQCYERLRRAGIKLSDYTTTNNSRDVAELMEALGGTNWNLYGSSYGTRLALSIIRDYPERVRSVILDSVYPPEINYLLETPFVYYNMLNNLFEGCKADEGCSSTFPNLESSFQMLLKKLHKTPLKLMVSVPDFKNKKIKIVVNDHRFVDILFQALYRWDFIGVLPSAIESALHGNYEQLMPIVEDFVSMLFDKEFNDAVYLSVECHDSFPKTTREEFMAQVARFPRVKKFVEKQWDYNLCEIWKVGHASQAFYKPVTSDIPTLFLGGEYDPVTPPVWAKSAAKHFSKGHVFIFPGIGHGVADSDNCASKIVQDFLQNPQKKPRNGCLLWLSNPEFTLEVK